MKYSLFTPKGLYANQGGKPLAEAIYETALKLFAKYGARGGSLKTDPGSLVDLTAFMIAITFARIAASLNKVDGERFAAGAYYLLAQLEAEHGLSPGADDTLKTRRAALAAAKRAPQGNAPAPLQQQLADELGDAFLGLYSPTSAEASIWPADLGDAPQLLAAESIERKIVRITGAVSTGLGASQAVQYTRVDPDPGSGHTLTVGDRLVVEPEILGRAEVVTVEAVGTDGSELTFTATFEQAHEPGCVATQMPFPAWTSSQKTILVALSADGAVDPVTRGKADKLLDRILSGVTTWALCPTSGAGTIGPWTLDDPLFGRLDCNPMDTVSVT